MIPNFKALEFATFWTQKVNGSLRFVPQIYVAIPVAGRMQLSVMWWLVKSVSYVTENTSLVGKQMVSTPLFRRSGEAGVFWWALLFLHPIAKVLKTNFFIIFSSLRAAPFFCFFISNTNNGWPYSEWKVFFCVESRSWGSRDINVPQPSSVGGVSFSGIYVLYLQWRW